MIDSSLVIFALFVQTEIDKENRKRGWQRMFSLVYPLCFMPLSVHKVVNGLVFIIEDPLLSIEQMSEDARNKHIGVGKVSTTSRICFLLRL